jgi:glycosyltransferase involved in cell wall biosynthesis
MSVMLAPNGTKYERERSIAMEAHRNADWRQRVLMVIPSINGGHLLARMLPTLDFPPSRVVVIDQGSTDNTAAICAVHGVELLQLGARRTYTEAGNLAASLARARGCQYLCIANNDIAFRNDVMERMHAALEEDPGLAMVAPAQIIHDPTLNRTPMARRVFWLLDEIAFSHDTEPADPAIKRLEADFCELTCALIRLSALDEVGSLDDAFGFYHEDADLGFRLRKAGYSCAYIPGAQIEHYIGSTVSREQAFRKQEYISRNKRLFARKHLGYAVRDDLPESEPYFERSVLNQEIQDFLYRYGLLAKDAPRLALGESLLPGADYVFTCRQAGPDLARWIAAQRTRQAVFAASAQLCEILRRAGIMHCEYIPLGIDPDVFHPWRSAAAESVRLSEATSYLAILHGQQQRLLRTILQAWHRLAPGRTARLVLYGPGLEGCLGRAPDSVLRVGPVELSRYEAEGIEVHDVRQPREAEDLAALYRSTDYTIVGSRSEDAALAALQSAACGTPVLLADLAGIQDFPAAAAIATGELITPLADPVARLAALLEATLSGSGRERAALSRAGLLAVRGGHTVRATALGFHRALSQVQIRRPSRHIAKLRKREDEDAFAPKAVAPISDGSHLMAPHSLGGIVARRIVTAGRVCETFGSTWQNEGLGAAAREVGKELSYFVNHRTSQAARLLGISKWRDSVGLSPLAGEFGNHSVLLVGYIDAQLGLGQSLRGLALAMSQARLPFDIHPLTTGVEGRRSTPYMPDRYTSAAGHAVKIVEVTVKELAIAMAEVGEANFGHSYNILRTYWELSHAPETWRPLLAPVREIWAPNDFVAASFRSIFDGPITIVPPCVEAVAPLRPAVRPFALAEGVFYFMFSFDYFSFPRRKNPLAVIRSFRRAFPDRADVGLVIKSTALSAAFPELRRELRLVTQDDQRIRLIEEELSRADMLALVDACDCYVSLHRAEGFGLGMVEAMAFGKPVIATDYSGSTDFLSAKTGYPVPYTLVPLGPDDYIETKGQVWAEPDEMACAAAMTQVVANPKEVTAKVAAARLFVQDRYSPESVGQCVARRLREIAAGEPATPPQHAAA